MRHLLVVILCFAQLSSFNLNAQCPLACVAELNVSLASSGTATLTPLDVTDFISPDCGSLVVSPNFFDCNDVGSSFIYTLTDPLSGNFCFGQVNIEDKFAPTIACVDRIVAALPESGVLELFGSDPVAASSDNCSLDFTISPKFYTCADVGVPRTATVTATDPGGNTATCFTTIEVQSPARPMICEAFVNISLPASGTFPITPDLIILPPTPPACALITSITSVDCSDIGSPIVVFVIDTLGGNSCWSSITVEDKLPPTLACNALTSVRLGAGGVYTIDPSDVAIAVDNCGITFTISPSQVSCADVGATIPISVTASDPGGNSASCFGSISVDDPRPSSCDIVIPASVPCGGSGVVFDAVVNGGHGPFTYNWSIKGNPRGWSITGGQGTSSITMDIGSRKINLEVEVTDVCGNRVKKKVKVTCNSSRISLDEPFTQSPYDVLKEVDDLIVYPNPVSQLLSWDVPAINRSLESEFNYRVVNLQGQALMEGSTSSPQLSVEDLPQGYYLIHLAHGSYNWTSQFIKI